MDYKKVINEYLEYLVDECENERDECEEEQLGESYYVVLEEIQDKYKDRIDTINELGVEFEMEEIKPIKLDKTNISAFISIFPYIDFNSEEMDVDIMLMDDDSIIRKVNKLSKISRINIRQKINKLLNIF